MGDDLLRRLFRDNSSIPMFKAFSDEPGHIFQKNVLFKAHAMWIMSTIDKVFGLLGDGDHTKLLSLLRSLGARHASYGAELVHYELLGAMMVEALVEILGPDHMTADAIEAHVVANGVLNWGMMDLESKEAGLTKVLLRSATRSAGSEAPALNRETRLSPSLSGAALGSKTQLETVRSFTDDATMILTEVNETPEATAALRANIRRRARLTAKVSAIGVLASSTAMSRAAYGEDPRDGLDGNSGKGCACLIDGMGREQNCCCGRWSPIDGNGPFRRSWDTIQVLVLMYVAVRVPLSVGFEQDWRVEVFEFAWWLDVCIDCYFVVDIVLNFNTTFFDEKSAQVVKSPKLIRANYVRGWFAVDLLACTPLPILYTYELLETASDDVHLNDEHFHQSLRLLRLAKLLRLARLKRILKRWQNLLGAGMTMAVQLFVLIFAVLFCSHVICWYVALPMQASHKHTHHLYTFCPCVQRLVPDRQCQRIS
jgi:hemoglobin-like flavoprotein